MKKVEQPTIFNEQLLVDARSIIANARTAAVHSVDYNRVMMYWHLGRRIFEEEQQGKERADYGARLIRGLAERLEPEYGSGFGIRQLAFCRQFYRVYPIVNTLCSQLNWSQYKLLISIDDIDKREYYQLEAVNQGWTKRELERQIHSQLWERLCLSNDKEAVLAVARKQRIPESPQEIIKDPMTLEFLGLEKQSKFYETDLEQAIINHLQDFLLEMGNGFTFVRRQRRITLDDKEFFVDLVLYNRLLRCFVLVDLKIGELTHQDIGQLQMYVNYFDRKEKLPEENQTIGILLCTQKHDAVVKMTLPIGQTQILATEYKLRLPTEEQLMTLTNQIRTDYEAQCHSSED